MNDQSPSPGSAPAALSSCGNSVRDAVRDIQSLYHSGVSPTTRLAGRAAPRIAGGTDAERARLAAEGRALVAFVVEQKREIAAAFYDIGDALVKLQKPGIAEALGHASFDAMCDAEIGLKPTQTKQLIDIALHLSRNEAIALGQTKAAAFARRGVRTRSGKVVGKTSSSRAIDEASKEFRRAVRGAKRGRGRTTTKEEQAIAHAIEAALHRAGVKTARVKAVASAPGRESNLRIEGVPIGARGQLAKALGAN